MLEVYRAAADLRRRFDERGWRFCLIGGLALQRWGEPRETIDVDVTQDLIVMKAFASRPKDWVDLEGIVIRQAGRLDWAYVESQLHPLVALKEEPEILERLAALRRTC